MNELGLSTLPFELAYLALLTRSGVKRLSRWEHALAEGQTSVLRRLGLSVAPVTRRTLLGGKTSEIVFSMAPGPVDAYLSHFDGRRLSSSMVDIISSQITTSYSGSSRIYQSYIPIMAVAAPSIRISPISTSTSTLA